MIRTDSILGHKDRVGGIAWHPHATLTLSPGVANIASGGGDTDVNLWSMTSYALKLGKYAYTGADLDFPSSVTFLWLPSKGTKIALFESLSTLLATT